MSWSTIVLMVFLSSRISPFTSTVIFLLSSPRATAVVTSAMFRTWAVRLPAIEFTLSVRSFHVPATPFTRACPPSLPSVPTSRATRVTSEANELSWSTIEFTVLPIRRNSPMRGRPSMSSAIVWLRSPLATAPITRATSLVGCTRSPMRVLTEFTDAAQEPAAPVRVARWAMRPSLPTARLTRSNSCAMSSFNSAISLSVSAIFPARPVFDLGMRTEKSPLRMPVSTVSSCSRSSVSAVTRVRAEDGRFAARPLPVVEAFGMVAPAEVH